MALTIQKNIVLQGVVHINYPVNANYEITLELPTLPTQIGIPNALDNNTQEEVYLIIDHSYTTNLILPPISNLKGAFGPKIYVISNYISPDIRVYPYTSETGTDTINLSPVVVINAYKENLYIHAVEKNMWMCLKSINAGGPA
jgi:hypothetical protein